MRSIDPNITEDILNYIGGNKHDIKSKNAYPINTYRELVEISAKLAYLNKYQLLFYRGQQQDYKNKAGNSTFYPTIYRGEYIKQKEIDYQFELLESASKELVELFTKKEITGYKELKRKKYIQWSILQHYEVFDTPLLDFTHSLRVACSFAMRNNKTKSAYVYVFGLPYLTNRISINSEEDLVNVRLLSICPPKAIRPYFQEGYLAGSTDITSNYDDKTELDFNRRLIAKFLIPNNNEFWQNSVERIPDESLVPSKDPILELCNEIKTSSDRDFHAGDLGDFLKEWSDIEQLILRKTKKSTQRYYPIRKAVRDLYSSNLISKEMLYKIDRVRKFRNELVHKPREFKTSEVQEYLDILSYLKIELQQHMDNYE